MEKLTEQWNAAYENFPQLLNVGLSIAAALAIFIVGVIAARWFRKRLRRSTFGGDNIDATLRPVIASIVFYFVLGLTLYAVLTRLGVQGSALLTIFASTGLAIGLAFRDALSNIAAGTMLLFLRPLQVGESVSAPNFSGTVQEIGLFSTTLKTSDGLYIYVPNGQVWNNRLQNNARHTERRLSLKIGVGFDSDLDAVTEVMLGVLRETPNVKSSPAAPQVYVTDFGESAITMTAQCWLPGANWMANTSDVRLRMKRALDAAGIEIPYPHRVMVTKP